MKLLYKHMSVTPAPVTSNLKQRLIIIWASISQNVIDKQLVNGKSGYDVVMSAAFMFARSLYVQA